MLEDCGFSNRAPETLIFIFRNNVELQLANFNQTVGFPGFWVKLGLPWFDHGMI